jgi:hypothetical protein
MPLSFGRALINKGAPFPFYQANLNAPFSQGRALSNLSGKLGCALLTGARPSPRGAPFPINQTVYQELRVDGGIAKPGLVKHTLSHL